MKDLTPFTPVKVTRCPTAYAAASSGQISADHAHAIREHNDAIEKARAEKGKTAPITFGKRAKKRLPIFVARPGAALYENVPDIADDLPDGYALNG